MVDFFISYTKADVEWAKWIAWELEKADYTCRVQVRDFLPGGDFIQEMRSAIAESKQVIALLSPAYFRSDFASAELNAALAKDPLGKLGGLIPIRVRQCDPSDLLRSRIYIDLVGKSEHEARHELLEGIRASRLKSVRPSGTVQFSVKPEFPIMQNQIDMPPQGKALPDERTGEKLTDSPTKLLFLAADCGIGLDLLKESKEIESLIAERHLSAKIHFQSAFDVTGESLADALLDYRPGILHFSGNMDGESILLSSASGGVMCVTHQALVGLLRILRNETSLVVLNACRSFSCASAIAGSVNYAIGVKGDISDEAAILFSKIFYSHIFDGWTVGDAFDSARSRLLLQGVTESDAPDLVVRNGADPNTTTFVRRAKDKT